ncbi:endoglucanase [Geothermobacter ehrlichii]|uniref:Endoglucanase n=1 Tax=Geothermobacter ehrlichii TaxID=213224 RepID=A0A5D3WQB9_9BACT|nr:M42 family metallopeptidase [Geothermobacter ehrlichii]TYO99999.1 endoglucanase [Geothermobacter ehrlichii]
MDANDFAFLRQLLEAPSPSGYEAPARRILRQRLQGVADSIEVDMLGNLVVRLEGRGERRARLMLTAHCDEIGFIIRHIDEKGFLWFAPIGGVDAHLSPGQRVSVQTASGPVPGVVGKKPIHQQDGAEKERVVPFHEQFIDIGCSDGDEARRLVAVGDPVVFAAGLQRLQGNRIACRALDDKMGAFLVSHVFIELARNERPPCDIVAVFSVQEEVGLRGAGPAAFDADPDVALVVEIGHGTDTPAHDPRRTGEVKLGGGPLLSRGPNINHALFDLLCRTAGELDLPLQFIGEPGGTGTDARVIQLSRRGVATALVRVPTRYVHTPSEVLDLTDLEQARRLLVATARKIVSRCDFLPS